MDNQNTSAGKKKWWIIEPQNLGNGEGSVVADLLNYIRASVGFSYIVVGNAEGAIVGQFNTDGTYIHYQVDDVLPLIRQVLQFDWCDLFCYADDAAIPDVDFWTEPYPDTITETAVTVRVWDHGNIEVFTQSEQLCRSLAEDYSPAICHHISLDDYTYAA